MAEWRTAHAEWERTGKKDGRPEPPPYPHLYTTDATVEALVPMLGNSSGLLLELDEMSGWVRAMDQYKNGKGADRQYFLSFWGCKDVKVDRKGKLHEPLAVSRPCLSVVGGIQPTLLRTLTLQTGDDGFLDRLLLAVPEATVPGWTDEEASDEAIGAMNDLFELLHALTYSTGEFGDRAPFVVGLSPEAEERLKAWIEENRQQQLGGLPEHLQGAWAKMSSQLGRLALILHALSTVRLTARYTSVADLVAQSGSSMVAPQVSVETFNAAIELVDYFEAHARRAHDLMRSGTPAATSRATSSGGRSSTRCGASIG